MRRLVPLVATLALAAAAAPAAEARSPTKLCQTRGWPLAGSAQVRVYVNYGRVGACSLENGRRVLLGHHWTGRSSGQAFVRPLAVAGRFVAWQALYCDALKPCAPHGFGVVEVRSGTRRAARRGDQRRVTDIVVGASGSAAWVEQAVDRAVLSRLDPSGEAVVAEAVTIRGLALGERSTLYWTEDGAVRSAPLEPVGPAPPVEVRRPRCGARGTTLLANPWARVYDDLALNACSLETRHDEYLGQNVSSSSGVVRVGAPALARRLVAWYYGQCGGSPFTCGPSEVAVMDLRTGRRVASVGIPDIWEVEQIVLKRNASMAFAQTDGIRIVDRDGDRMVGRGGDLALSRGSTVYWTDREGVPHSAPLH